MQMSYSRPLIGETRGGQFTENKNRKVVSRGWEEETGSRCLTSSDSVLPGVRKLTSRSQHALPEQGKLRQGFCEFKVSLGYIIWAIALVLVSEGKQEELHHKWMYSTQLEHALRNSEGRIPWHTYLPQLFFFKLAVKTMQLWCKDRKPYTP